MSTTSGQYDDLDSIDLISVLERASEQSDWITYNLVFNILLNRGYFL